MVTAIMIIEMMGKPAGHLEEALKNHVKKMGEIKGIELIRSDINEPTEIKDEKQPGFFSCFAEVEVKCKSFSQLSELVINFMPSSVEVVDPSKITLDCNDSTEVLSHFIRRLHEYDNVAKQAQLRLTILNHKLGAATKLLYDNKLIDKQGKLTKKAKPKKK